MFFEAISLILVPHLSVLMRQIQICRQEGHFLLTPIALQGLLFLGSIRVPGRGWEACYAFAWIVIWPFAPPRSCQKRSNP